MLAKSVRVSVANMVRCRVFSEAILGSLSIKAISPIAYPFEKVISLLSILNAGSPSSSSENLLFVSNTEIEFSISSWCAAFIGALDYCYSYEEED